MIHKGRVCAPRQRKDAALASEQAKIHSQMNPTAEAFAQVLINHHRRFCAKLSAKCNVIESDIEKYTITYGTLCKEANAGIPAGAGMFLNEIHKICQNNGLPPLNALAVNAKNKQPGHNYPGGLQRWDQDVRECLATKSYPLELFVGGRG